MRKIYWRVIIFGLFAVLFGLTTCLTRTDKSGSFTSVLGTFVENGRHVADLVNYRITYFEPVEGPASDASPEDNAASRGVQETDAPFIIADWGPRDELPQEIKKPSIYVVF